MTIHSEHPFLDPEPDPVRRWRGRLGGAVSLWTSGAGAGRAGLTVSSLMVANGDPARLLGLVDPDSDLVEALESTGRALVQLLGWEHRGLADAFAGTAPAPGGLFRQAEFEQTPWGPRLVGRRDLGRRDPGEQSRGRLVPAGDLHRGRGRRRRGRCRAGASPRSLRAPGRTTAVSATSGSAEALLAVADELYGLPLAEFTPTRDARARELKGSDPELSRAVKALRKPSTAAWVANLLVRHESEQVGQVLAVGEALRQAQADLAGEELRGLTRQRRQLTAAVTGRARAVAAEHGQRVTGSVADQVEATLTAAMVDEDCSRALRSGLLVAALASTGLEAGDVAGSVALPEALGFEATASPDRAGGDDQTDDRPGTRPELHVVPDPEAGRKARADATRRLEDAQSDLDSATEALADAVTEVGELEARSMQVQAEIDELKLRLAELEARFEEVDDELSDAEVVRSEAQDSVAAATAVRDEAAAALDQLP